METIECSGLTKSFDGVIALDEIDLAFESAKITALIGPNGAGKTTLFHIINGYVKPDAGKIFFKGVEIQNMHPWEVARLGICRLFQDVRVFTKLNAIDNVMAAFKGQMGENPLWAVFKRKRVANEEDAVRGKAKELLDFVGLKGYESMPAGELSYGQQKLLSIARLLANGGDILLLDEPTAGVNPEMIKKILSLIRQIAQEGHKTIVIIEHNMNVVMDIADWVFFMDEGRIEAFGSPRDVLSDKEVRRSYIGL